MPPGTEDPASRPFPSDAVIELRPLQLFVVRLGLARDADGANRVLIATVIIATIAALGVHFFAGRRAPTRAQWIESLAPEQRTYFYEYVQPTLK